MNRFMSISNLIQNRRFQVQLTIFHVVQVLKQNQMTLNVIDLSLQCKLILIQYIPFDIVIEREYFPIFLAASWDDVIVVITIHVLEPI